MCAGVCMQDSAMTSTSNLLVTTPVEECGKRLIIRGLCPPRSPDLNVCDYCL